jgi:anion-transporting  ArsA/GET3 family ATPase
MLVDDFLAPKILIVAGKGGVGKTTVAGALALVAARRLRRVCVAEVDRKGSLARLFGAGPLEYEPSEMLPGIWGLNIEPEKALEEYLESQYRMRRVSRVFTHSHFLDYITTAAPGLRDILILGKVWYLEQGRSARGRVPSFATIVFDTPATGHMRPLLAAPAGLSDAVKVGPIRRQSDWLGEMLRDPRRARVHLVTLPEEMPVEETLETSQDLAGRLRLQVGHTFANGVYEDPFTRKERDLLRNGDADLRSRLLNAARSADVALDPEDVDELLAYARFLNARRAVQTRHLKSLHKESTVPVVELPFVFAAGLDLPDLENIADVIEERIEAL